MGAPDFMLKSQAVVTTPGSWSREEKAEVVDVVPQPEPEPPPQFVPGVFPNMPAEVYHRIEALSSGGGKKLRRSPMHYKDARDTPDKRTPAKDFGTAVHSGVLELPSFADVVVDHPEINKRTKLGKAEYAAFVEEHDGKIVLSPKDYKRVLACMAAVRKHPGAMKLLAHAITELSLFWVDAEYGNPCKARFDIINLGGAGDLKTTTDASEVEFAKDIANWEYNSQAAHYISGAEHALDETPRFYAFIVVESEPPHAVATYYLGAPSILAGQHLMSIAHERYKLIRETGQFPGYSDMIECINVPRWALRFS